MIRISPYCRGLCSKRVLLASAPPRTEADLLDGSQRVWCRRTMQAVGPDGELVDPDACRSGRGCFEPYAPAPRAPASPRPPHVQP